MPYFSLRRFGPVFDLSKDRRLYPDGLMGNTLGVGLCFADQRGQPLSQIRGRGLVEAVVDLAGIDQLAALAASNVDAIPFVAIESKAGNRQGLALSAGLLTQSGLRAPVG